MKVPAKLENNGSLRGLKKSQSDTCPAIKFNKYLEGHPDFIGVAHRDI
jgi:hypothetical protein